MFIIHDVSVRLTTGSIPGDINRFQSHTEKYSIDIINRTKIAKVITAFLDVAILVATAVKLLPFYCVLYIIMLIRTKLKLSL